MKQSLRLRGTTNHSWRRAIYLATFLAVCLSLVGGAGSPVPQPAVVAAGPPTITSVTFAGPVANPQVTINGSGFGATAPAPSGTQPANATVNGVPCTPSPCTGANYGSQLYFSDTPATTAYGPWTAGRSDAVGGNFIGISGPTAPPAVLQYSDTTIQYSFGTYYTSNFTNAGAYHLSAGDQFTVYVLGASCTGIVSYSAPVSCAPAITSVTFGGSLASPSVTVNGQNFGSQPTPSGPQPTTCPGGAGFLGSDYAIGQDLFTDNTVPWNAGQTDVPPATNGTCIGIIFSSYTTSQVVYSFGTPAYGIAAYNWSLHAGDSFTLHVAGAACAGTVPPTFPGTVTCATVPVPALTLAETHPVTTTGPVSTTILGQLTGATALTTYSVNIYTAPGSCPTSAAQATLLGSVQVTTDPSGSAIFSPTVNAASDISGSFIAATATDPGSGTSSSFSSCAVATQANDSWVHARTLTLSPTTNVTTTSQYVYAPNQERWYKVHVTPGSTVHVSYSGSAGAALSLHSDIPKQYAACTAPASEPLQGAQDEPGAFQPGAFQPGAFQPGAFQPGAFQPGAFQPGAFQPGAFQPGAFQPGAFQPAGYQAGPYLCAGFNSLLAVSSAQTTNVQSIDHPTWNDYIDGNFFYLRVAGGINPSAPFTINVSVQSGSCSGVAPVDPSVTNPAVPAPPAGGLKTLILYDPTRMPGPTADFTPTLNTFSARSEVQGAVVNLSQYPRVAAAQAQADTPGNIPCPAAKNLVATEIKSVIKAFRDQNPTTLKYIVLVGSDYAIPFFRYPDTSGGLGREDQYVPPVLGTSATNASLRNNYVLGQDEYGASLSLKRGDVSLPLPDLAVGRLVESTADVTRMLHVYMDTNGLISPASALVTGYDFLASAAISATATISAELNSAGCGASCYTPDTLIQPAGTPPTDTSALTWHADDLRRALYGKRHDLVVLAAHASAGNLLASDYASTLNASEVASSTADLSNTLVLLTGCHAGTSLPVGDTVTNISPTPDWARTMAIKGATLLGSTGYSYADTDFVAYSALLYTTFLRQLSTTTPTGTYTPVAVGDAAMAAKRSYLATHADLSGLDMKTLLEISLYGLPMTRVGMPGQHFPASTYPAVVSGTQPALTESPGGPFGLSTGLPAGGFATGGGPNDVVSVTPTLSLSTTQLTNPQSGATTTATHLEGPDGVVNRLLEPVYPLQLVNVSVPNQVLRGVGLWGGTVSDRTNIVPLTDAPATENSVAHPAFFSDTFYPTKPWTANYFNAVQGGDTRLALVPAQYRSTSHGSLDGTLRQYTNLRFRLYYLPSNWTTNAGTSTAAVATAPYIAGVTSTVSAGPSPTTTFNVRIFSDPSVGIQAAWVTYVVPNASDPTQSTLSSLPLSSTGGDGTLWQAASSTIPPGTPFMVQAVNGTGRVSLATNYGALYTTGNAYPQLAATNVASSAASGTPTTVTLGPSSPTTGDYGTTATFNVQLQPASGPTLANQPVTLSLGSHSEQGTTDATGLATITLRLDQTPGAYNVVASYAGNGSGATSTLAASSSPLSFTVTKAATQLTLTPGASADYNDPGTLTATLTIASGTPLSQKTVLFTVSDAAGVRYQHSAFTDYAGRAALGPVPLPAGSYTVNASFGDGGLSATDPLYQAWSDPFYSSSGAGPAALTITPEEATVVYSGDTVAPMSSTVQLTATVARLDDPFVNDLTRAQVRFAAVNSAGQVVATTTAAATASGLAVATLPGILADGVYAVSTTVVGGYFTATATPPPLLAVYNPNAGFVTGGGWINSPPGSCQLSTCAADGSTVGKATFGFVAKYQRGATVPSGDTAFEFQAGSLDFHSTAYQWLTIAGSRAQYKGTGTINGQGNYGFMLTAIDGDMGGPQSSGNDSFRIKLWDNNNGAIVYDNQMGQSDTGNAATTLGGGNIIIHSS